MTNPDADLEDKESHQYFDTEESSPGGGFTKLQNKAQAQANSIKNQRPQTTTVLQKGFTTGMGQYMKASN